MSGDLPPRSGRYRLGVFGGQFDPPHVGHRAVVDAVWRACGLDRVVVVPAGRPPHRASSVRSGRTRLALAVHAFAGLDHVVVSDVEVERAAAFDEPTYTVETLEELVAEPAGLGFVGVEVEPTLVVGADQLAAFTTWHRWEDIVRIAGVAVVDRPASDPTGMRAVVDAIERLGGLIQHVPIRPVDVSSSAIRAAAVRGDRRYVEDRVAPGILDEVMALYNDDV